MSKVLQLTLFVVLFFAIAQSKTIYDWSKSKVVKVSRLNFEKSINKPRTNSKQISILHFFKDNDGKSFDFGPTYEEFADQYQGVFMIAAIDCKTDADICEKEKVKTFPLVRIYVPQPMPSMDVEGELDTKKILKQASKLIQSNIIEVTSANADTFVQESPSVPKALLFTNSKGSPMIYKALSISFEKKIFFGIVRSSDEILMDRYGVKDVPAIILIKANEKKPKKYSGEMNFKQIFEFFNVYSEAFVAGGGSSQDSAATKSWLLEVVPQMNYLSAKDICFSVEGGLCVIVLTETQIDQQLVENLKQLNQIFDNKLGRGSTYKYMWLDLAAEPKWKPVFQVETYPSVVVLNPGKRKRFVLHEGDLTVQSLKETIEKINGGDARFKALKGDLPEFTLMKE